MAEALPGADGAPHHVTVTLSVSAVVHDAVGRVLLVRRGHEPALGTWSLPGGKVESGESFRAAVTREVTEETGLVIAVTRWLGVVEVSGDSAVTYVIHSFAADVVGGQLASASDATDAAWFTAARLAQLPQNALSPGLLDTLHGWALMPR